MTTIKTILRRLGAPVRGESAEREIEDELRFHIEMRTRDNIQAGMPAVEAEADALQRFGNLDQIRAACEAIRRERLDEVMKAVNGITLIVIGCGLMLKLMAPVATLQSVGNLLILIAGLWRVLIHLRKMRPAQRRIIAAEQPSPSVIGALSVSDMAEDRPGPIPAFDKVGRTPVERLISDDE